MGIVNMRIFSLASRQSILDEYLKQFPSTQMSENRQILLNSVGNDNYDIIIDSREVLLFNTDEAIWKFAGFFDNSKNMQLYMTYYTDNKTNQNVDALVYAVMDLLVTSVAFITGKKCIPKILTPRPKHIRKLPGVALPLRPGEDRQRYMNLSNQCHLEDIGNLTKRGMKVINGNIPLRHRHQENHYGFEEYHYDPPFNNPYITSYDDPFQDYSYTDNSALPYGLEFDDYDDEENDILDTLYESKVWRKNHNSKIFKKHGILIGKKKDIKKDKKEIKEFLKHYFPGNKKRHKKFRKYVIKRWLKSSMMTKKKFKKIEDIMRNKFKKNKSEKKSKVNKLLPAWYDPNK